MKVTDSNANVKDIRRKPYEGAERETTTIRSKLKAMYEAYIWELTVNPEVAERYLAKAHGYRMGLELVLNKNLLDPILAEFPTLWEDYEND